MNNDDLADKVFTLDDTLAARMGTLPRPMVFTNGVFDVLHRGHVNYLHEARKLGASLVVAVNTDMSARGLGKGPDRPLNRAIDRALVLAGLASVSAVTFFDDNTPVALLSRVRPDIYVKGGDYRMETLEESRLVTAWGGSAVAIPFVDGYSTTALVRKIQSGKTPPGETLRKAAFLDRDGVINVNHGYVHRWADFQFLPGALRAMVRLHQAGYAVVVVTNQSGLARGLYTETDFDMLSAQLKQAVAEAGGHIEAIYHCPHHPRGQVQALAIECDCRKPAPGMLIRAAAAHRLDVANSLLVGDKFSDIAAAKAAGVGRAYLVGNDPGEEGGPRAEPDAQYASLAACVDALLGSA